MTDFAEASTIDDTTLRRMATPGAQGRRLAALIVGTTQEENR